MDFSALHLQTPLYKSMYLTEFLLQTLPLYQSMYLTEFLLQTLPLYQSMYLTEFFLHIPYIRLCTLLHFSFRAPYIRLCTNCFSPSEPPKTSQCTLLHFSFRPISPLYQTMYLTTFFLQSPLISVYVPNCFSPFRAP
jgi:hypothetical protein